MTNLIEVPEHRDDAPDRKIPSWLWVVVAGVLVAVLGIVLTFNASSDRDDAESTRDQAVSLADTIERACAAGNIPEQFSAACAKAPQTKQEV